MKNAVGAASTSSPHQLRQVFPLELKVERIQLPKPLPDEGPTLEACIRARRSRREYLDEPLSFEEANKLLWAAQGITGVGGLRAAPSAGAFYPLRSYFFSALVEGIPAGIYRYNPDAEELLLLRRGDRRKPLRKAACGQECAGECACALLLTASWTRLRREFGEASYRLACVEAGHAGQNFCLEAVSLGLGSIGLGKLDADAVRSLLTLPSDEEPLYLLLAGRV